MRKIIVVALFLLSALGVAKADALLGLEKSIQLMELCKNDAKNCELVTGLVKDNILFSYSLGAASDKSWQSNLAQLFAVPSYHCIDAATPAQLRHIINEQYANVKVASVGAGQMVFNALSIAAVDNCEPVEI